MVPIETVSEAEAAARVKTASPVPDKTTFCGLPLALSLMLRVPLSAPLAVGWNETLAEQLCPTFRVFKVALDVLVCTKFELAVMELITSVEVPVFVMVTVCAALIAPTL